MVVVRRSDHVDQVWKLLRTFGVDLPKRRRAFDFCLPSIHEPSKGVSTHIVARNFCCFGTNFWVNVLSFYWNNNFFCHHMIHWMIGFDWLQLKGTQRQQRRLQRPGWLIWSWCASGSMGTFGDFRKLLRAFEILRWRYHMTAVKCQRLMRQSPLTNGVKGILSSKFLPWSVHHVMR